MLAELQGGSFGSAFLGAGVTKWLSPAVGQIDTGGGAFADIAAQSVVAATIGGTASAITGNGFGSGAQAAGFQYLFNQVVSNAWQSAEERIVQALRKDGVRVLTQVWISTTLATGETVEAIADYAFRRGDTIVFGEIKYGMDAKFTPNQKAVYAAGSALTDHRPPAERRRSMSWAQRLKRVFGINVKSCINAPAGMRVGRTREQVKR